ncbi:MAG: hypothetical protein PHF69_06130 [Candidatus Omnitrophica bacterium]|nr:hypothetical protein [Candidatus Omnitrophota bacterium]
MINIIKLSSTPIIKTTVIIECLGYLSLPIKPTPRPRLSPQ